MEKSSENGEKRKWDDWNMENEDDLREKVIWKEEKEEFQMTKIGRMKWEWEEKSSERKKKKNSDEKMEKLGKSQAINCKLCHSTEIGTGSFSKFDI